MEERRSWIQMEPIMFLEGSLGLNDDERELAEYLVTKRVYPIVLDNLYETPEKIVSMKFLTPKTIVLGTTGVYKDELKRCIECFKIAEHIPDNIVFSFGEENLWQLIKEVRKKKPKTKFFKLFSFGDVPEIEEMSEGELPIPEWNYQEILEVVSDDKLLTVFKDYFEKREGTIEEWYSKNIRQCSKTVFEYLKSR